MDVFKRPHIEALYGGKPRRVRHVYPRHLLHDHSIFPLLPLDTGAFLFCMDTFKAADGDSLLNALNDGSLFKPWMNQGKLDWNLAFKQTHASSLRNLIEKQAWPNRLYFLLPLAQHFFRTRDEAASERWFNLFTDWQRQQPFKKLECKNFYKESNLVWFDIQVCWRILVLVHSIYLLADSSSMTRARWKRIYAALDFHVKHLHQEAVHELATGGGRGNHFLQKGTALLYAGICFP